jgi:peptide-methionine (R)-S-oxide reductase
MSHMTRRDVLRTGSAAAVAAGLMSTLGLALQQAFAASTETFEVTHTDAEWRKRLDASQYSVLRQEGTERPFSSPLNGEHRPGTFFCAGCDLALFSSKTKFESGTGWPSFYQPLENAVHKQVDTSLGMTRDEIHCRRCGSHIGHVFDDGPKPTGLRYCMNGVAMVFKPQQA